MIDIPRGTDISDLIKPPADPDKEWTRQADFLAYNFARQVGYGSREQYIAELLPPFFAQSESWKGKFDAPVLVQVPMRELTLVTMADILEIAFYADAYKAEDWFGNPQKRHKLGKPYSTYLGLTDTNITLSDVRANLTEDARAGNVFDTMMIYKLLFPEILERLSLSVPGSEVGPYGLFLTRGRERPIFYCRSVDLPLPDSVSVVAGREILTK